MRWTLAAVLLLAACSASPDSSSGNDSGALPITVADATSTSTLAPQAPGSAPVESSTTTTPPSDSGVQPVGFETTVAVVTAADGTTCELCVWLADTATQRSRGLMFVTDLGIGDGMAFRYPKPRTGTFWMKNTFLPLSIAFFAPDGAFMSSFDMEPCTTSKCPNYRTADDFLVAVEVPQGELARFGIGAGSSLELLDLPCE